MYILKTWILRLAATALISAVLLVLAPESGTKKILRTVCGLASVAALISPFLNISVEDIDFFSASEKADGEEIAAAAASDAEYEAKAIIEERCSAYILDKARELDPDAEASVETERSEAGYWYPAAAVIRADISAEGRNELQRLMTDELGITAERQKWCSDE